MQKTLKFSKKKFFNSLNGWEKTSYLKISAEGYQWKHVRCKLLQKISTGKTKACCKQLQQIAIEKDIFSELNRCIFQISLKYIKLVVPKILFILVLSSFNFYFKIMWPPPSPPTPKKTPKLSESPLRPHPTRAKTFLRFLTPTPQAGGGMGLGGTCPVWGLVRTLFVFFSLMFLNIYYWEKLTFSKIVGKVNFLKRKSEMH